VPFGTFFYIFEAQQKRTCGGGFGRLT